jgi:glycosyltransferase involved in cell wall biosynthesis
MIAVQNGARSNNGALRRAGWKVVGFGRNLGHGLALDWGLRHVKTEFVLICDPDAVIVNSGFIGEVFPRLRHHGVCGLVISERADHQRYHPICTAFRTALWKDGDWSMRADRSRRGWDVGTALTEQLGGVNSGAVLPMTRPSKVHGVLWANGFSNIYGASRARDTRADELDGRPIELVRAYHRRWREWAEEVAAGTAGADEFPVAAVDTEPEA